MAEEKATETIVPPIAAEEKVVAAPEDAQVRFAQLEAEKENYRKAYLKEADKNKNRGDSDSDEDERTAEIARKVLAESRLAEITREQDSIIQTTLKENKELKLALSNKKEPPAAAGTHQESTPVRDTLVTPDQMTFFKSKGWTDKDIERYKKNLTKRI